MARQQFSGKAWTALLAAMMAGLVPAVPAQEESGAPCPDYTWMENVGYVCKRPDGSFDVYTPDGIYVGPSHGPDPIEPDVGILGWPDPVPPVCVTTPSVYHSRLIYARASDHADQYASKVTEVRNRAGIANAYMSDAGVATGRMTDLRVWCDTSATMLVANAVLPTGLCCDSFSTIVNDLRNLGYNDPKVHYWVYYDGAMAGACGTGHRYNDDSDSVNNLNNGNGPDSLFAVLFAESGTCFRTFIHELSHTMGAVQNSAPHSTGAGHCWDGFDALCYNDGGPSGGLYTTSACPNGEPYDCGNDDYFDASPLPATYLDTHWNIADTYNRYIYTGRPRMDWASCPGSIQVGRTATCTFQATDVDSGSIYYGVDWGDGQTFFTGWVTPGQSQSMSHQYAEGTAGDRLIRVLANDGTISAPAILAAITVTPQNPPVMNWLSCPAEVSQGTTFTCSFSATDDSNNVYYAVNWGDGSPTVYTGWLAPGTTASMSKSYSAFGTFTVSATATDDGSPQKTGAALTRAVAVVENLPPVMQLVSCPSSALEDTSVSCSFRATDDSGSIYYAVNWGDGSPTVYSGWLAPGTTVTWSHAYATPGTYSVSATATDSNNPQKTSAPMTAAVVITPNDPPIMEFLSCPMTGQTVSCTFRALDDSGSIYYALNWGDEPTTWYSSWLAPGTQLTWSHTYGADGTFTVSVTATDNGNPQMTSTPLTTVVIADTVAPTMVVLEPRTGFAYVGCNRVPTFPGLRTVFIESGCVIVDTQDSGSGVTWVQVYLDGVAQGSPSSGGQTIFIVPASQTKTAVPLRIEVTDRAGNMAVWNEFVNVVAALPGPV